MFQRILQWLREVLGKMITQADVKQALGLTSTMSTPMMEALRTWSLMYENKATWVTGDMKSMNLPATIAAEIGRAVTIEMVVKVEGSLRADFLNTQMSAVVDKLRQQVEYGVAKGGLVMKPYVSGDKVIVDFVQADQFYPIAFDASGSITACVFSDQRAVGDKWYTRLEYHQMVDDGCEVVNNAFVSTVRDALGTRVPLTAVRDWAGLAEQATIKAVKRPLFGYFKFPMANNIDTSSPLGVSCYSRVVDLIKQADQQWTDFLWEFESGRRALFVDTLALERGLDGKPRLPGVRLYRTLSTTGDVGGKELFEEWTPTLREANILNGLDAILRRIEFNSGLAYGTLSNPQTVDKTATEIKIAQQRSYSTITDTQKALTRALEDLLYAMDVWVTISRLAPGGVYRAIFDYDDSVIVDKETQFIQDLRLVSTNIMSRQEFRRRNFGEDEATAKQRVKDAEPEPAEVPGFGAPA